MIVTVNALPAANAGADVSICTGSSTTLSASGGTSYTWSPTTGLGNPNIANPVASPTTTATYTVTVTDGNGCTDSDPVLVTVNSATANAGTDVSICSGSSTTLSASGGVSYAWSPATGLSNPNITNPVASPTTTTIYTLTVIGSVSVQLFPSVTVKVYIIVVVGEATGFAILGLLKPVAGLHA